MKTLREIITKDVIKASPEDSLSSILGKAKKYRIHQLPVVENNKFIGMIFIKDIVIKDIDAEKTKARSILVSNTPRLDIETSILDAARKIIQSGFRALPVFEKDKMIGIISETDLIFELVKETKKENIGVEEIMTCPICLEENSTIGKIKHIMRENNISRVPIIDKNYNVVGVIDTLDLVDLIIPKESQKRSREGAGEKLNIRDFPIKMVIRRPFITGRESKIRDILNAFREHEEVIVVEDGKPIGIITPKDVLEILLKESIKEEILEISNIRELSDNEKEYLKKEMKKIERKRKNKIEKIFLYIETKEKGRGKLYFVRARVLTKHGVIVARSEGRSFEICVKELVERIDKEIERLIGKHELKRK
ncbi:MAG: CBS domain-containing protein [Candidatus Aenigmatarchaeota archaeon]